MFKMTSKNKILVVLFILIFFIFLFWVIKIKVEDKIIRDAIAQYKNDKAISGEPNVEYDENGMIVGDERFGNAGMPKTLVLKGVPIICFEWANMGDNSKCTNAQIDTIKIFFKNFKNSNWDNEYFDY